MPVYWAHLGRVSALDQQHKPLWIDSPVIILDRHHTDRHLGNRKLSECFLVEFYHPRHVGGLGRHFVFVVGAEFQAEQAGQDDRCPDAP